MWQQKCTKRKQFNTLHSYYKVQYTCILNGTFSQRKPFSFLETIAAKQSIVAMVAATKHLLLNVII